MSKLSRRKLKGEKMEIRNNKSGETVSLSDEKWDSLMANGWGKFWTPVKKKEDLNMTVAINKKVKKEEIKIEI